MSSYSPGIRTSFCGLTSRITFLLLATLGVLLFSVPLFSQGNFGRILGSVTDQTGGVISNATITIIDKDRGVARTLTTDDAGEYNAPTLIPGTYMVRVEANGFKKIERQNVVLEVGKEVRVDLTVQPGEQTQTVTVTEAIPLVETTNATLGGTLSNEQMIDIPLNGRLYQNLLSLRPGVMTYAGGSPWTQSTNNSRPDESVWMVDGVINVNFYDARPIAGMPSPFTDGATILPIDAIQEFNLEENPKAEYGWRPGAVVNVGIKSGTNTLHGSAYAFGRDQSFDARNVFNPAPNPLQPLTFQQFGGVVGGPIKKDKLFFFTGYEGLRSFVGNALGTSVPELAGQPKPDPKNSMVDALNALKTAGAQISPVSMSLFGCSPSGASFTCNGGLIQGAAANSTIYTSGFPNTNVSDNGIAKLDYRINDKHQVNGVLFIGNYTSDGEDHPIVNKSWENGTPIRTYTATANWIWSASSSIVNDLRFGYDHVHFAFTTDDQTKLANGKDYPLNTGITSVGGFPTVIVTGFSPLGGWRGRPLEFTNPYYSFQDNISYLKGKHSFKFGAEFTHIGADFNVHDTRGRIDFRGKRTPQIPGSTPLEDFFAGRPDRGFQLVGTTPRSLTWREFAGFVQDDWRVVPKLIVNLGLRYSYISPMKEANNLVGSFDPTLGMVQQGQGSIGDTLWKPDHKNFSPRVGFAWDVTGKGTTVVRGGASIIYSMFTTAQFTQSPFQNFKGGTIAAVPTGACKTVVAPGVPCPATFGGTINLGNAGIPRTSLNWDPALNPTLNGGVVFPTGAVFACAAPNNLCDLTSINPNLRVPYMENWTLGITHAFTTNLSLEVGYVGTHGSRLTGFIDLNQFDPNSPAEIACGHCENNANRPYGAQFPYLRYINQTVNDARSNYNSLQATLTERVTHGLSFTSGYTYGHGLDNGSLSRFGNLPQDSRNPGQEYGNSDFDIRNRFTFTASYELPGKKGFAQLLEGWKLNSVVTLQGGLPWLVNDQNYDFSGSGDFGDRWDFFGNPADFKSGSSSIPYCTGAGLQGCSVTSGVSGIQSFFSPSDSTAMWAKCTAVAPDTSATGTLATGGCFVSGNSVMVPPKFGTYGTMGRNIFRDSGFKNLDFSIFKNFKFTERFGAQFRLEFFNVLNHPIIANPYGASNGWGGGNDPGSSPTTFADGLATPDVAAGNPLVGSGSARLMQLGLKLMF